MLTLPERQAYDLMRKAMPRQLVLAQVPLARFISDADAPFVQRLADASAA